MKLKDIHSVYFIGIGGIGMSALARWFKLTGKEVAGYDRTPTPLTSKLIEEGIELHFEDQIEGVADNFKDKAGTLVIYTPAIPKDHGELNYFKQNAFNLKKRAEVLGLISKNRFTIAVAGTHGKTTTSSMIAHILNYSGLNSAGFIGGVLQGYESNLILHNPQFDDVVVVAEADEFDRSFLHLSPNISVITSADADHLDIYGEHAELIKSFNLFIDNSKEGGSLFVHEGIEELFTVPSRIEGQKYGINCVQNGVFDLKVDKGRNVFTFENQELTIKDIRLSVPGIHNVENACAAMAVCLKIGIDPEKVKGAIENYKGVKRRFEYIIERDDLVFIDDYAHHPKEIEALLKSVRLLYPDKKVTAVFQPHLYTRTKDFYLGFAESLDLADEVLLLDIYPARELPIEGVDSEMILRELKCEQKAIIRKEDLVSRVKEAQPEILLTIGAGDIDQEVELLKEAL